MPFKSSLPWDLEQAMTAFQVDQNWYEEYWLRDTNDLTSPQSIVGAMAQSTPISIAGVPSATGIWL